MNKKMNSLKMKLTIGVGITFLAMIVTLTTFSVIGMNQLFVVPVQRVVPALLTVPVNSVTAEFQDLEDSIHVQDAIDATVINTAINSAQVQFNILALISMALIGCLGTGLTYLFIKKTVKPLDYFSKEIAMIDEKGMNEPPHIETSITEIQQLSDSFDKMLERLNQSFENQKRFSTAAAHQLKTPLAIIKANMDVLEMDSAADIKEYQANLDITKRQVERMRELIDNLFLVSSSESYEFNDKVSIVKLIENLVSDMEFKLKEKDIRISIDCEDKVIIGNETMLSRAIANLLDNSIKYCAHSQPMIKIYSENNQGYQLIVEDNGIGISEEDIPNIFEAFYRADKSRSRKIAGSGLGLAITKDIIEAHQGKITISSVLNEGTKIIIEFD